MNDSSDNQKKQGGPTEAELLAWWAEAAAKNERVKELLEKWNKLKAELGELETELCVAADGGEYIRASQVVLVAEVKHHAKDEEILAFISSHPKEVTTADIQEQFGFSSATVSRRMKALLKSKKVTVGKRSTKKIWKVRP